MIVKTYEEKKNIIIIGFFIVITFFVSLLGLSSICKATSTTSIENTRILVDGVDYKGGDTIEINFGSENSLDGYEGTIDFSPIIFDSQSSMNLKENTDYTISIFKGEEPVDGISWAGTYIAKIKGIGKWNGEMILKLIYYINASFSTETTAVSIHFDNVGQQYDEYNEKYYLYYTGRKIPISKVEVGVLKPDEYIYQIYKNGKVVNEIKELGTYSIVITLTGEYRGTYSTTVIVERGQYCIKWGDKGYNSGATIESWTYDGQSHDINVDIYLSSGVCGMEYFKDDDSSSLMIPKTDYTYAVYKGNKKVYSIKDAGTYALKVSGLYNQMNAMTFYIKVLPRKISACDIYIKNTEFVYNKRWRKPNLRYIYDGWSDKSLVKNRDYTFSCAKKKAVGKYQYVIRAKGKNYKGVIKGYWKIVPKTVNIKRVTSKNNKVYINIAKQKGISGYQIRYYVENGHSYYCSINKKGTRKKLPKFFLAGKRVTVCVRAYKTVKGTRIYSRTNGCSITVKGAIKQYL